MVLFPPCEICHKAKQTREPFSVSQYKSKVLGELAHIDVWGPYRVTTVDGYRFFLTIVDDYTQATWLYLMKSKDEVYHWINIFFNILKNQFNKSIKIMRTDNGTEFVNQRLKSFLENNGIIHQTTCVYTPQQNGVVERKHRHLLNVARSLLFQSGLPLKHWGETVLTATFLVNRTPSSVLNGLTPFEMVYKRLPVYDNLRVFGCLCFSTNWNNHDKLSERSEKCVFLGYSNEKKDQTGFQEKGSESVSHSHDFFGLAGGSKGSVLSYDESHLSEPFQMRTYANTDTTNPRTSS